MISFVCTDTGAPWTSLVSHWFPEVFHWFGGPVLITKEHTFLQILPFFGLLELPGLEFNLLIENIVVIPWASC